MKNLFKNPSDVNKLEYWAVTSMFVFSVFFLVSGSINQGWEPNKYEFDEAHQQYSYLYNYFIPTLIRYVVFYGSYLLITFIIAPSFVVKNKVIPNVILTLLIFYWISVVLAVTDTWIKGYLFNEYNEDDLYSKLFEESIIYSLWLLMMFTIYTVIKHVAIYLLENSDLIQSKYRVLTRDGIYAFIIWMIALFLLLIGNTNSNAVLILSIPSLCGIFFYCYSLYALIPPINKSGQTFKVFFWKLFPLVILSILPLALIMLILSRGHQPEVVVATSFFHVGLQMLITAPLSWYLYKQRISVDYEIMGLKTALGRSTADLNFLRSQINPHFLFNVLNTLYGTALQENAERTSEGIQKLGDMMRFMLRENLQEKISLTREIEYLNNYIGLQTLRTQSSPEIIITTEIEDHTGVLQIAPMLLIPFVENAFKHGISLKEPSHIRISLGTKDNTLFFDISNSTHAKASNDPEKDNNGIGLNNVKQRLRLMYSTKHELSIRESGKEFFVHLTIQLD
jgi:two-component system LytT family sensor kinase